MFVGLLKHAKGRLLKCPKDRLEVSNIQEFPGQGTLES